MQITNEKPQIDHVIDAHIRANGHEIEQKDRSNDEFEIYSCFREFETANLETQKPEVKYLISFITSILYGNLCKVVESGLNYLQITEHNSSNLKPELTETGLQIVTGWTAEPCFCPLVREDWN
jgi:hypothetical protein